MNYAVQYAADGTLIVENVNKRLCLRTPLTYTLQYDSATLLAVLFNGAFSRRY